jgi:hypothetical protein
VTSTLSERCSKIRHFLTGMPHCYHTPRRLLPCEWPTTALCQPRTATDDQASVARLAQVSDAEFAGRKTRFPYNPPETKEYYMLRTFFDQHFPGESALMTVPTGKSIACSTPEAVCWDPVRTEPREGSLCHLSIGSPLFRRPMSPS